MKPVNLTFTLLMTTLSSFSILHAQTDGIVLRYDFSSSQGTTVPDATAQGISARLMGDAKITEMGSEHILSLGASGGYLDMGKAAGDLYRSLDELSVSVYYRIADNQNITENGNFLWVFSSSASCTASDGRFSAYRVNAQRASTSTGGYSNQQVIEVGSPSDRGIWKHVAYTQSGAVGWLYIDGRLVGTNNGMSVNSVNLNCSLPYCWLGRSPFVGDVNLRNTLIADFRLYDHALSADEVKALAKNTSTLEQQYKYGTPADFTDLRAELSVAQQRFASLFDGTYPDNAIAQYQDAINIAQLAVDEGRVSQTFADSYLEQLRSAYLQLQKTAGYVFDESDIQLTPYDTNRGFRHPGGIHTQADFDRVRQQIADGNGTVLAALQVLRESAFASSATDYGATAEVSRAANGGGNWLPVARDASRAYQLALRWKLEDDEACAQKAVTILNDWARTNTRVTGGEYPLCGIYGGQLAQAAELMRDYDGWAEDDFLAFRQYMRNVWYPFSIEFLRWREGTWVNATRDTHRASHWWSNWGLCNAWALVSIGVLCDDVFIYNQGLSYIKDDLEGEYSEERLSPIVIHGPTEFMGNLIPVVFDDERGPYGKLGQMQESGRDQGHCLMSIGMIADICLTAWNQGDDLFSYMDNRLAAGIEFVAAYNYANIDDLPWQNYKYLQWEDWEWDASRGWVMTGPSGQTRGGMRNYWGKIVGHYEGVKGVKMQYSEMALARQGIDGGASGAVTGNFDALGYSVLMNTREPAQPDAVPTLLTPRIYNEESHEMLCQNYLGGRGQNFEYAPTTALTQNQTVTLMPQLPAGEVDTGLWLWNTGETTRNLSVTTDRSQVYRVCYTNQNGVESEQNFTIAVAADCMPDPVIPSIYDSGDKQIGTTEATVFYGDAVRLHFYSPAYYGYHYWDTGVSGAQQYDYTIPHLTSDRTIRGYYLGQGGRKTPVEFHLKVETLRPSVAVDTGSSVSGKREAIVQAGSSVTLSAQVAGCLQGGTFRWDDGTEQPSLTLENLVATTYRTLCYTSPTGIESSVCFTIYVTEKNDPLIDEGYYAIRHRESNTLMTNVGGKIQFALPKDNDGNPSDDQIWNISRTAATARYDLTSVADNSMVSADGELVEKTRRPLRITPATDTPYVAIYTSAGSYWDRDASNGALDLSSQTLAAFPFELIRVDYAPAGISVSLVRQDVGTMDFDLSGRRVVDVNGRRGIYIVGNKKIMVP